MSGASFLAACIVNGKSKEYLNIEAYHEKQLGMCASSHSAQIRFHAVDLAAMAFVCQYSPFFTRPLLISKNLPYRKSCSLRPVSSPESFDVM